MREKWGVWSEAAAIDKVIGVIEASEREEFVRGWVLPP